MLGAPDCMWSRSEFTRGYPKNIKNTTSEKTHLKRDKNDQHDQPWGICRTRHVVPWIEKIMIDGLID